MPWNIETRQLYQFRGPEYYSNAGLSGFLLWVQLDGRLCIYEKLSYPRQPALTKRRLHPPQPAKQRPPFLLLMRQLATENSICQKSGCPLCRFLALSYFDRQTATSLRRRRPIHSATLTAHGLPSITPAGSTWWSSVGGQVACTVQPPNSRACWSGLAYLLGPLEEGQGRLGENAGKCIGI